MHCACVPVSKKREIEEMIRTIRVEEITKNIKEMCIEANHFLSPDMAEAMKCAEKNEEAPLGKQILEQLQENLKIAGEDMIPICQDMRNTLKFSQLSRYANKQATTKLPVPDRNPQGRGVQEKQRC